MRTIVVGVDAFEWWYAERLMDAGKLPHLAALRAQGTSCRLANHLPYRAELSWNRFLTGADPLTAGTWPASVMFQPSTYIAHNTLAATPEPFYAGTPGPVIAFDLVHASLAEGVEGDQVLSWGVHAPQYPRVSSPAGLLREVDQRFGASPAAGNDVAFGWHDPDFISALEGALLASVGARTEAARWLMERRPDWSIFLTAISEVHSGGHLFWHGVDPSHVLHGGRTSVQAGAALEAVCIAADDSLGALLEGHADANVVVFALHGMEPADDIVATVLLPDLLYRNSTGRSRLRGLEDVESWRRRGCPPLEPAAEEHWHAWMRDHFHGAPGTQGVRALRRFIPPSVLRAFQRAAGRTPPSMADLLHVPAEEQQLGRAAIDAFEQPIGYQSAAWYRPDWPTMRTFALPAFADGHVRVNLVGREATGVVAFDEYRREVEATMALVSGCRDVRTGRPVVEEMVWLREDDPLDPDGPPADLLIVWKEGPDAIEHPDLGVIGPIPSMRTGYHSPNGFALIAGPQVPIADLGTRSVDDLTATVTALAGIEGRHRIGEPLVQLLVR